MRLSRSPRNPARLSERVEDPGRKGGPGTVARFTETLGQRIDLAAHGTEAGVQGRADHAENEPGSDGTPEGDAGREPGRMALATAAGTCPAMPFAPSSVEMDPRPSLTPSATLVPASCPTLVSRSLSPLMVVMTSCS